MITDLARLIGDENAQRLADAAGGTRLFVPKYFGKPPHGGRNSAERLTRLLGEPLAVLLVFHFGGSAIYVPTRRRSAPLDPKRLTRLERKGLSAPKIALLMGCSARTIEKHRARRRAVECVNKRKDAPT